MGKLGTRRRMSPDAIETDIDRDLLHLSKEILQSDELDAVGRFDARTGAFLRTYAIPSHLKNGIYLVPVKLLDRVDAELMKRLARREELVTAFIERYEELRDQMEDRLKNQFNPAEYPPKDKLRAKFRVKIQYLAFDAPTSLREINKEIFERERERAAATWNEAMDEARKVLRVKLAALVDKAVEKLSPDDASGKKKKVSDPGIAKMNKFLELFEDTDITDDAEMRGLCNDMRALLQGVTPDAIKSTESVRAYVTEGFAKVQAALDDLIVDRPRRQIRVAADAPVVKELTVEEAAALDAATSATATRLMEESIADTLGGGGIQRVEWRDDDGTVRGGFDIPKGA